MAQQIFERVRQMYTGTRYTNTNTFDRRVRVYLLVFIKVHYRIHSFVNWMRARHRVAPASVPAPTRRTTVFVCDFHYYRLDDASKIREFSLINNRILTLVRRIAIAFDFDAVKR